MTDPHDDEPSSEVSSTAPSSGTTLDNERTLGSVGTSSAPQSRPLRAPITTPLSNQLGFHGAGNDVAMPDATASTHDASRTEEDTEMITPTTYIDPTDTRILQFPVITVYGHAVSRLDSLRTLLIDGALVRFTPTEYRLLIPILEGRGTPVPFRHLTTLALEREPDRDARRLLDKHIDHIRSKLRAFGLNVHGVARFGYILLAEQ